MLGGLIGHKEPLEIFEEGSVLNHEFDNITEELPWGVSGI